MARNRQRARDRKRKLTEDGDSAGAVDSTPAAFEHSGSQDEIEARLEQGSGGLPPENPEAAVEAFGASDRPPVAPSTGRSGPRFWNFLKACWAELQRVQWPDRQQVGQATAVVLGFVLIAGVYLGVADRAAKELVDLIL